MHRSLSGLADQLMSFQCSWLWVGKLDHKTTPDFMILQQVHELWCLPS